MRDVFLLCNSFTFALTVSTYFFPYFNKILFFFSVCEGQIDVGNGVEEVLLTVTNLLGGQTEVNWACPAGFVGANGDSPDIVCSEAGALIYEPANGYCVRPRN